MFGKIPLKALSICKSILRKGKINFSLYNMVILVRDFKPFFLWSCKNINYIWKHKTLAVPDFYYYKTLRINYFYTYKTCNGNNNCIEEFNYTHPPAHFLANKFNKPTRYLQHKRKLWAKAQQVQMCYLTKNV